MRRNNNSTLNRARGFSLIELIIVMVIIGIIAAAVMPRMGDAMGGARESTALQHLRTIHAAQASYFSRYGVFAENIAQLGPKPNAGLISADLAAGEKMGYRFAIVQTPDGYALTARPCAGQGSVRSFYSDSSLVVHYAPGAATANVDDPELGSARAQPGGK